LKQNTAFDWGNQDLCHKKYTIQYCGYYVLGDFLPKHNEIIAKNPHFSIIVSNYIIFLHSKLQKKEHPWFIKLIPQWEKEFTVESYKLAYLFVHLFNSIHITVYIIFACVVCCAINLFKYEDRGHTV
jgi:hypothetical protein